MSDCCSPSIDKVPRPTCPASGDLGTSVSIVTLQSLLLDEAVGTLDVTSEFYFCPGPGCDIVYFNGDREQIFRKVDVKVRVGQKETSSPIPLCYCFGHSFESIRAEIEQLGASTAVADIRTKMKSPGCACEVKNPQGSCCLGNVTQAIKRASAAVNTK